MLVVKLCLDPETSAAATVDLRTPGAAAVTMVLRIDAVHAEVATKGPV